MNTIQNNKDLTKHVKYFQEVYPINLLPATLIKPSITVNHKHYMPGSHWVAVCISDLGYAEYFDSYGLPPYKLKIMAFLQRHSISRTFNRHRLHELTSKVCGHYCCIYALHRARGQSMTSFVNTFVPALTPATIKRQCPCSAISLESDPLAAGWRSSSSRARRRYKGKFTHDYQSAMSLS